MKSHVIAASILSLGFLASGAFAQSQNNNACPTEQKDRSNYIDCIDTVSPVATATFGAAVINPASPPRVGDYVDETPEETNERSKN